MSSSVLEQIVAENSLLVRRLSVRQLQQMLDAGVLSDAEPLELIDGLLVHKDRRDAGEGMTHGPKHASVIRALGHLVGKLKPIGLTIQLQLPVTLTELSQPEPAATILRDSPEEFRDHHPSIKDIVVVIEVADTSLRFDRTTKQRLYAACGVPNYWIINLQEKVA